MGKVCGRFLFLCVPFILHFVLLALNCACLGASLAALASANQVRADSHAFPQGRNNHALSQRYAAIHALHLRSKLEASSYWPFEWPTLTVEGDTEQACGPRTMPRMNNQRSTSLSQKGLDVMQSHPLCRTCFSQYQASSAALG